MHYTLVIPQLGVVRAGLLSVVDLTDLAVFDVLRGMSVMKSRRCIVDGNRQFTWAHYAHVIKQLPLVFNPEASAATLKNQLVRIITTLRSAGLVETQRHGRRQFFRMTDLALQLHRPADHQEANVTKKHEDAKTKNDADIIMPGDDNAIAPNISDPGTNDPTIIRSENLPTSLQEVAEELRSLWSTHPGLQNIERWTKRRLKTLNERLNDDFFRSNWRAAIQRIGQSSFCRGQGQLGWRANVDWFLRPDTLTKIMEGLYDRGERKLRFGPGHYNAAEF